MHYTLDYIAALIRSPINALHGLAVHAVQCQVLFANDFFPTRRVAMLTKTNAVSATSQEITSQEQLVRVVSYAPRTHH